MVFYIFANLFYMWPVKDSWTLKSASSFNLLQFVVSVEIYDENTASRRCVAGHERISWTPRRG